MAIPMTMTTSYYHGLAVQRDEDVAFESQESDASAEVNEVDNKRPTVRPNELRGGARRGVAAIDREVDTIG